MQPLGRVGRKLDASWTQVGRKLDASLKAVYKPFSIKIAITVGDQTGTLIGSRQAWVLK